MGVEIHQKYIDFVLNNFVSISSCLSQANSSNDLGSALLSPNLALDDVDGFFCPQNMPPLTEIGIHSTETLQITITKSFLAVLNSLSESFSISALRSISEKEVTKEPFIVVNKTGHPVTLMLGEHRTYSFSLTDQQQVARQVGLFKLIFFNRFACAHFTNQPWRKSQMK